MENLTNNQKTYLIGLINSEILKDIRENDRISVQLNEAIFNNYPTLKYFQDRKQDFENRISYGKELLERLNP